MADSAEGVRYEGDGVGTRERAGFKYVTERSEGEGKDGR